MKNTLRLLAEKLLNEVEVEPVQPSTEKFETGASIDAQIDRYFSDFESEASESLAEGVDYSRMVRKFLNEADSEDELDDALADAGDEPATDVPTEDDTMEEPESLEAAPQAGLENIDVESFANSVNRLIENFEALLEIKKTVLRRACNHLLDHYDDAVVTSFRDTMREVYGIDVEASEEDIHDDEYKVPFGVGGGPDSSAG